MVRLPFTRMELRAAADAYTRSASHVNSDLLGRIINASKTPQAKADGLLLTPVEVQDLSDAIDREGQNTTDPATRVALRRAFLRLSQCGVPRLEHGPSVKLGRGK